MYWNLSIGLFGEDTVIAVRERKGEEREEEGEGEELAASHVQQQEADRRHQGVCDSSDSDSIYPYISL